MSAVGNFAQGLCRILCQIDPVLNLPSHTVHACCRRIGVALNSTDRACNVFCRPACALG